MLGTVAHAAPLTIKNDTQNWTFQLDGDWTEGDASEEPGILRMWHHRASDRVLVLSRMRGNTDAVWSDRAGARDSFFDGVEAGVRKQQPGYKRLERRARVLGTRKVPTMDLWYRSGDGKQRRLVGTRFLFFRTIGFMLILDAPGKSRADRDTRRLLESFQPLR